MFNKEVVVRCESGLHNKQATYFVQKANEFESSIWLESGSRKMNAKSLLGIMTLGIVTGTTVTLSADGPDEIGAIDALKAKVGIRKTIRDYGIQEQEFLATLDEMVEQAFDDQCTGANPRYPLLSEIKQMYLNAYYGN